MRRPRGGEQTLLRQQVEQAREAWGPQFVRDVSRLLGLPDDASMDSIISTLTLLRGQLEEIQAEKEHFERAWNDARAQRDEWQDKYDEMRSRCVDALETIEAIMCDRELCGHFLPEEIRAVTQAVLRAADAPSKEGSGDEG